MPLPVIDKPYKRIGMDLVGPLPRSKAGYRYILTVMDYCTRYPEAIPLKKTESDNRRGVDDPVRPSRHSGRDPY